MDANFCWKSSSLLASVDVTELKTTDTNMDLTKVKYSTYKHSREKALYVME
jgi:hypothetical protein